MEGQLRLTDRLAWAEQMFGRADLGDIRRTRRLVRLSAQMAHNSSGSIPQQAGSVADMKAAYRLFAADDVTHEAVCTPHWQKTRALASARPVTFLVQDTMELNFTDHRKTEGLAPVGKGNTFGLHQQNVLAVDPASKHPLGLMYQRHHRRKPVPTGETRNDLRQRALDQRESYGWVEAIGTIGQPAEGCRWVHVIDRGGDTFGVFDACRHTQTDFIVRAGHNRRIEEIEGHGHLFPFVRSLQPATTRAVVVRDPGAALQAVTLNLAAGVVRLLPSKMEPELRHRPPITCHVVRAWEAEPPASRDGLEWILLTSLPIEAKAQVVAVAEGYSWRWLIEEFHKAEKTGCNVEQRQLTHTDRLEPLIGVLSVLAVRLLELKYVARDDPHTPATSLFDEPAVHVMSRYLQVSQAQLTVAQFWRGIGRLGGHPGRKGDGPLGWLRAWRGWQAFQWLLMGAGLMAQAEGEKCG